MGSPEISRLRDEVEQLRSLVESNEDVRHQVVELEERVEFAERMLARGRDQLKAGPG